MDSLGGRTVVVTGGGSGLGRAMALRFAGAGANVVVADIDDETATAVAGEIVELGARAITATVDVADAVANDALLAHAVDAFGQVNVVCLNAGVNGSVGRSWTLSDDDWQWSLGILLNGVINGIRSFVPHLISHGDGHVVITSSIAGHISSPYTGPYNVAKHGLAALAESLYHELQADQSTVGVTCLCPGFVNTNLTAAARARADDEPGSARDEKGGRFLDFQEQVLGAGLDPGVVGELVHDAVLDNQFWVFTDRLWDDAIRLRATEITERRPPTPSRPTQG